MMKSRSTFPPSGWFYYQPETNWPEVPQGFFAGKTFDQAVDEIIKHRKANPRFNLATDWDTVANQLDEFTDLRLRGNPKAREYLVDGGLEKKVPVPPSPRAGQSAGSVAGASKYIKNTAAGIGLYAEWFGDGEPVPLATAMMRANVCLQCPKHNRNLTIAQRFSEIAAKEIMAVFQILHDLDLHLPMDDQLRICEPCDCPLKAKVWSPLELVLKHIRPEAKAELWEQCWITEEEKRLTETHQDGIVRDAS